MTLPPAPARPVRQTPPAGVSPLGMAYDAAADSLGPMRITEEDVPRGADGWLRGSELSEGGAALEELLAVTARNSTRAYGQSPRDDVTAGFALHRYVWPVTVLFTLPHFLLRRVPRFTLDEVAVQLETGRVAIRGRGFSCLPDDPAAGLASAVVVPDEAALRDTLRDAYARHLEPLIEVFRPRMRRGRRVMWALITDELAEGLWYLGKRLDEEARARAETALLLPGHTAPYTGGAGFRELVTASGARLPTRDRVSCCLYYTLRPDETCVTCPRTCDATRVARLAPLEQGSRTRP